MQRRPGFILNIIERLFSRMYEPDDYGHPATSPIVTAVSNQLTQLSDFLVEVPEVSFESAIEPC